MLVSSINLEEYKMKTALIIGGNGNFGTEMAIALQQSGWRVRALVRDAAKADQLLKFDKVVQGDATSQQDVEQAALGADVIVYAANPPYHRWPELAMKMLEPTILAAQKLQCRILFPGNVYGLSPSQANITEEKLNAPVTEKGRIRVLMETRLEQATNQGAKVSIVRAGDFIGPKMASSWLSHIFKNNKRGVTMAMPHDEQHEHFWTYLPDLCANAAQLLNMPQSDFDVWHDPGFCLKAEDWRNAFAANSISVKTTRFPWWMFTLLTLVSPMLKEVMKMRYLWQQRIVLDGQKMTGVLGDSLQKTPLTEIIMQPMPVYSQSQVKH
jgi:nucleoside-diphosphate-sugar epimerase